MRSGFAICVFAAILGASTSPALAQEETPSSRQAAIEQQQAEKQKDLRPYRPGKAEQVVNRIETRLTTGGLGVHPFFESPYSGGGFTLGAGYRRFVSPYNTIDVRGSYTIRNYKRAEVEFAAPHLFNGRGELSLLGGWREATQVGFYGLGINASSDNRRNYSFEQPYGSALLTVKPTGRILLLRGGVELTKWSQGSGDGASASVETGYTPATLPGLGADPTYVHTQGTLGIDWRTSPGYSRRGGFYGVTVHDFNDRDDAFGFQQVNYEAIQHLPILRETWVLSLRGLAQTTYTKSDQQIPFFMLPSVGGGSSLRGFTSWRFRDRHSLLLQAEWRIIANRFLDTAVFYDAGKVASRTSDLDLNHLKSDFGFGVRFHGPVSTPLRIEVARSNEGVSLVFSASPAF